jgi:hypothetical protein
MTTRKEILDALFELCPSEYFDRRIGGRRPNNRIRSTICHPQETLASLERRFPERDLIAAGVAKRDPFGELQIVPELCQTRGLIMALRKSSTEPPCDLVTARGSLVGRHPVLSALADGRRAALVEETGMMLAAHRIQDVAALDMIGLPATLGLGLSRLGLSECRELDALYGEGLPVFEASDRDPEEQGAVDGMEVEEDSGWKRLAPNESLALRPLLILIEQLDRRRGYEPLRWLQNTARWFASVRRNAGLSFAGVWVWQPDDDFGERLKFAYRTRKAQIREVVLQSLASLVDFESVVESVGEQCDEAPSYLTARSGLIKQLAVGPIELPAQGNQLADSLEEYDLAVQRELAEPLINWASQNLNPVIRAAGAQLAEVVALLHRITPRLHATQVQRLAESFRGDGASLESGLLDEYMRLLDRFSRLAGEIAKWLKS